MASASAIFPDFSNESARYRHLCTNKHAQIKNWWYPTPCVDTTGGYRAIEISALLNRNTAHLHATSPLQNRRCRRIRELSVPNGRLYPPVIYICAFVCVRERQRERQRDRETEGGREGGRRMGEQVYIYVSHVSYCTNLELQQLANILCQRFVQSNDLLRAHSPATFAGVLGFGVIMVTLDVLVRHRSVPDQLSRVNII